MIKDSPIEYPIDGTLDLHQFSPSETREIVTEYIKTCRDKGLYQIRIVHGKGKGVQRKIVHSVLSGNPIVKSFHHEGGSGGGWGATIVELSPEV